MTTGASSSNSDASPGKRKGWPRGRKRRMMPKDTNAPKGPLSGYMLFMNEQRETLKQSPSKHGLPEITKIVAQKWAQMEVAQKQKYLEAAEADKGRYQEEMEKYKKTASYRKFIEDQGVVDGPPGGPKRPKKETPSPALHNGTTGDSNLRHEVSASNSILEIPIFTEEFLNHNKSREGELRQLRKSNTEYEEQNTILQKHIESMRGAVSKLEDETRDLETKNTSLKQHLSSLRKTLSHAFAAVPIPGSTETPKEESVDGYLAQLHSALTTSPLQHPKLGASVKQIVNALPNN